MNSGRLTQFAVHALDSLAKLRLHSPETPAHLRTGRRGEEAAYFYLRTRGYVMVARNWRSPRRRGEIDLIGWEGETLCFIEVKTRTTRAVAPAEAAVDEEKQNDLRAVAREYLRHFAAPPTIRFDVVSVYYDLGNSLPAITLFKNAFTMA
ncbi:MAG: YraN family protein [Candidatus Acidiferrum sp.]